MGFLAGYLVCSPDGCGGWWASCAAGAGDADAPAL